MSEREMEVLTLGSALREGEGGGRHGAGMEQRTGFGLLL